MPVALKRSIVVLVVVVAGFMSAVTVASALDGDGRGDRRASALANVVQGQSTPILAGGVTWTGDVTPTVTVTPTATVTPTVTATSTPEVTPTSVVTHPFAYTAFLPVFFAPYDMLDHLLGAEEHIFEVQHSGGSQARHQTQEDGEVFFHTKGNEVSAEWEELWADEAYIYRGTDTSPGHGQYYTLRDPGMYGSKWAPRYWAVGDIFERNPHVTFYDKQTCTPAQGGTHRTYLKFEAFHESYTFQSGITLENVVELAWLLSPNGQPVERYYYAESYGLVGWWSSSGAHSYISEDHEPGTRPDNVREVISCLDRSPAVPLHLLRPLAEWPGEHGR